MNQIALDKFIKEILDWIPKGPIIDLRTIGGEEKFRGRVDRKTLVEAATGIFYEISYNVRPVYIDNSIGKPKTVFYDYNFVIDDQIFKSFIDALRSIPLSNFELTTYITVVKTDNLFFNDPISGLQQKYSDIYYVFKKTYDTVTITHRCVIEVQNSITITYLDFKYPRALLKHEFLRHIVDDVWETDYKMPILIQQSSKKVNYLSILSRMLFRCMK